MRRNRKRRPHPMGARKRWTRRFDELGEVEEDEDWEIPLGPDKRGEDQ
jgi:hypothetical protein